MGSNTKGATAVDARRPAEQATEPFPMCLADYGF